MARSAAYDKHPQHVIRIEPAATGVRVTWQGNVVAESQRALLLHEGPYPPAYYLPRDDARLAFFERSDHSTHCPFKGDAAYFSLQADGERSDDAVWTYEDPFDQVAEIRDHLAFYADRVTIETLP
jgi:uncharacterized protein (DUF427 family)